MSIYLRHFPSWLPTSSLFQTTIDFNLAAGFERFIVGLSFPNPSFKLLQFWPDLVPSPGSDSRNPIRHKDFRPAPPPPPCLYIFFPLQNYYCFLVFTYLQFSKHWPSGPMLSISRFVCLYVCVSVCLFVHF